MTRAFDTLYGRLLLASARGDNWDKGNRIHKANILMGRAWLHGGHMEEARDDLLAAGRTPGSPQLNAGGWATSTPAQQSRPVPQPPDTSAPGAFTGTVVFHQAGGSLRYRVRVAAGKVVGGQQDFGDRSRPFAAIVGGWFDRGGKSSACSFRPTSRSARSGGAQAQHFRVDEEGKAVSLEHALYGYGIHERRDTIVRDHVLDAVEPGTPQAPN